MKKNIPPLIMLWLLISSLIILWDILFIFMRPASFAGGSLAKFWVPYVQYIKVDTSYADMNNHFVVAQAIMSVFEIIIVLIAFYLHYIRKSYTAILFAFSALLLTGTKTILIFVLEIVGGFQHIGHATLTNILFLYVLPNAVWIIIPFCAVFSLGRIMMDNHS